MKFEEFRYRYFLITKSELRNQKTKCVNLLGGDLYDKYIEVFKNEPYNRSDSSAMIADVRISKVLAVFMTSDKSYVIDTDYFDLSALEEFKVGNKYAYNQNIINMSSIENKIVDTYAVDGVWSLVHYITSANKNRLLLNKNSFGKFSLFKTRDYKIHKLLEE